MDNINTINLTKINISTGDRKCVIVCVCACICVCVIVVVVMVKVGKR